jgi:hypothetical protein
MEMWRASAASPVIVHEGRRRGWRRGRKEERREGRGVARREVRLTGGGTSARRRRAHLLISNDIEEEEKEGGRGEGRGENVRAAGASRSTRCKGLGSGTATHGGADLMFVSNATALLLCLVPLLLRPPHMSEIPFKQQYKDKISIDVNQDLES